MHDLTRYAHEEAIGAGGFADVFRAIDIVTKQVVALKRSRSAPDCVARCRREIEVQRQLVHANVMPILDWAEDGSWFVMPLASGSIPKLLEEQALDGASLVRLVEDVGAALAAAHRRRLVHRDLSPANILWLRDRWVVADWGFVRLPPGQPRTRLTRTGVGTESFTAPEVYRDGSTATSTADVYSLGRLVGWLRVQGALVPGSPVPIDPGDPWAPFVTQCSQELPEDRPQTVESAMELLTPILDQLGPVAPIAPVGSSDPTDTDRAIVDAFNVLLQDPARRIQLESLIDRETETVFARLSPEEFSVQNYEEGTALDDRLARYGEACRAMTGLLINGCAYGAEEQSGLWTRAIRRIGHPSGEWAGVQGMLSLRFFPTCLLMYAGALAAIARERWFNLAAVSTRPRLGRNPEDPEEAAVARAAAACVMKQGHARTLAGMQRMDTPVSEWLFAFLREPLRPLLRIDEDYDRSFDLCEYLFAMAAATQDWAPLGRFGWKSADARMRKQPTLGDEVRNDIDKSLTGWGPLHGGMFSDVEQALKAVDVVEATIKRARWS